MFKKFLILGIFVFSLFFGNFCLAAIQLISPSSGASDVPLDGSFQWNPVAGADRYALRINSSLLLQDNVPASACSSGICNLYFIDLSEGARPQYGESYSWDVVAYNAGSVLIDSSPIYSFTSEQEPPPSCNNDGDCDEPEETPQNCSDCTGGGGGDQPLAPPLKAASLWELINTLINFFFIFGIALGPLLIIYASVIMMTSAGNPEKLAKARMIITWTIIALVVLLIAKAIPAIVKGSLGG
jgi:hypothetical protein